MDRTAHKSWIFCFDCKVAKELCTRPILFLSERWREGMYQHLRSHQHNDPPFMPTGTNSLRKLRKEMFNRTGQGLS